jgi:hypothetical protein
VGFDDLLQGVDPVDDCLQLSGFNLLLKEIHVLACFLDDTGNNLSLMISVILSLTTPQYMKCLIVLLL